MKKPKSIIWAIVVAVTIICIGIYIKLVDSDMMRVRETFMQGDIYGWIRYDCSTNEVDELIMHDGSPLNIYFTNRVFTFDGSNIVAQFAYSEMIDGKQLFASTNMLFWVNRSGKIVKGPIKMVSSIQTTREELNMEKFIKGWIWVSHRGTEKRQDEYMQTNSGAIFLTNQVFSFGGSNITARFASPRKVDDMQIFANTNVYFWADPFGKIVKGPYSIE